MRARLIVQRFVTYLLLTALALVSASCSVQSGQGRNADVPVAAHAVFFGDSLTYGAGTSSQHCFPATAGGTCFADRIARALGLQEVNKGLRGTSLQHNEKVGTCPCGIDRFRADLMPEAAHNDNKFYILYGIVDVQHQLEGDPGLSTAGYQRDLDTIVHALVSFGVTPSNIYLSELSRPDPRNCALDSSYRVTAQQRWCIPLIRDYNRAVQAVAAKYGTHFARSFEVEAKSAVPYLADYIHPNDQGHELIAEAMLESSITEPNSLGRL